MSRNSLLETQTANLNDILGNGKIYSVPPYQRDYSWREENWEDLWEDLLEVERSKSQHYMGAIVLQKLEDKKYWVIDGQQRLATMSMLAIACIKTINSFAESEIDVQDNLERAEIFMRQFIGSKDPVSLRYSSKLFLNESNDPFYQSTILQFRNPINERKLKDSEKLMWEAFTFFDKKISEKFGETKKGTLVADFLNKVIAENLLFIQIIVEDDLNAYTVFETLNSRGVELTSTDLLKNFLFSKVSKSSVDLGHVKQQWASIIDLVGLDNFPVFLRHYLNSREPLVTKEKLFKRIKQSISSDTEVFDLLDNLEKSAYLYDAMDRPADEFWHDFSDAIESVKELKLFKVTQYRPLILAAFGKLSQHDFSKLIKYCAIISFRYNIIGGLNANELEKAFNKAALSVSANQVRTAREIFHELRMAYLPDEQFLNSFSTKSISAKGNKKLVRYILVKIENHLSNKHQDFETSDATIEHILPENPSAQWDGYFSPGEQLNYVYRLGNYTLLEESKNRKLAGNADFSIKKGIYSSSEFALTKDIQYEDWTPEKVKSRQVQLAKYATSIWRID